MVSLAAYWEDHLGGVVSSCVRCICYVFTSVIYPVFNISCLVPWIIGRYAVVQAISLQCPPGADLSSRPYITLAQAAAAMPSLPYALQVVDDDDVRLYWY